MKIRIGIFGVLLVFAAAFFSTRAYGEEKFHLVQRGETFYSIARSLGIKADDLMKYNGITDPSRLQAGQRLKIPGSATAANTGMSQGSYRVVRGDTLFSIARKFSVSVASIQEVNSLPNNYVLREGDTLRLPLEARITVESLIPAGPSQNVAAGAAGVPQSGTTGTGTVNSSVRWPVAARELSYMTGKLSGVVITGLRGESVNSLTLGIVLSAGPYRGFGRVVIVQVEGGYLYFYGGCESLSVKEGDKVGPGTELRKLGVDAVSNKPQLFFMVYRSNTPVDPAKAPRA